jgi:uncharacterized protein YggE
MIRRVVAISAPIVAVAALASCSSGSSRTATRTFSAQPISSNGAPAPGTITVSGHGIIDGTPDTLTLSIGVDTSADTAVAALSANSVHARALIDTLKAAGIAARDIQTSQLSVNARYDTNGQHITGYTASNHVTAKLHDLAKAGTVIDTATKAVGDSVRVDGVSFSIDDTSGLVAQARAQAVKKAAAQANQLAAAAGVKLGQVRSIDETNRTAPYPQYLAADAAKSSAAVPLQPGTQELSLDVSVVYEIVQ